MKHANGVFIDVAVVDNDEDDMIEVVEPSKGKEKQIDSMKLCSGKVIQLKI